MTAPLWQPGQLYAPGDVVSPRTTLPVLATAIANPSFESDDADWTGITGGWSIDTQDPFQGSKRLKWTGVTGDARVYSDSIASVVPGQRVTARIYIERFGAADQQGGYASLAWYDASDVLLREDVGNEVGAPGFGWRLSTVSGVAPANAAKVQFYVRAFALQGGSVVFDSASWDYAFQGVPTGLLFTAVQADPARSAADEPSWPTTNGSTVVDGGVTWEASFANRVVWRAVPILKSGATEPVWPETPGAFVSDGTISWETVVRNITDPRCPNTKVVAIGASKVFCGDDDIIAYSATANPLDWSSADDAGFLPFGLQQYGANPVAALGLYRSNLVGWNSQGMQIWQIDEDPARMQLLDAMPIGSTFSKAVSPVMNDLLFLTQLGVRSIGIAGASTNLAAGDVGSPVDPLVRGALTDVLAGNREAISTYYPALGQYILSTKAVPEKVPVPTISGNAPDPEFGASYSYAYEIGGGTPPLVVTISGGALPGGLSISSSGVITGNAVEAGSFSWTVRVTDSLGLFAEVNDSAVVEGISLLSNLYHYFGRPPDEVAASGLGIPSNDNLLAASPVTLVAASARIDPSSSITTRLYNPITETWGSDTAPTVTGIAGGLSWSPDGTLLAVGTYALSGTTIRVFKRSGTSWVPFSLPASPNTSAGTGCIWSPDGSRLVVVDGGTGNRISIYQINQIAETITLQSRQNTTIGSGDTVQAWDFIPGQPRYLVTGWTAVAGLYVVDMQSGANVTFTSSAAAPAADSCQYLKFYSETAFYTVHARSGGGDRIFLWTINPDTYAITLVGPAPWQPSDDGGNFAADSTGRYLAFFRNTLNQPNPVIRDTSDWSAVTVPSASGTGTVFMGAWLV